DCYFKNTGTQIIKLLNIMKTIIPLFSLLLLSASLNSQNITNTLGTGGVFSIKDNASIYFSLSQSTGNASLSRNFIIPTTTSSSVGVVFKDGDRFLHNYQAPGTNGRNTFLGVE